MIALHPLLHPLYINTSVECVECLDPVKGTIYLYTPIFLHRFPLMGTLIVGSLGRSNRNK
jgi:hypothetical protein